MSLRYEIAKLFLQYGIALLGPKGELPVEDEWAGKVLALINEECEWTMSPKDLEADKHRLFVGCRPNTIFPLSWDKIFPYCPCCGRKIKVK